GQALVLSRAVATGPPRLILAVTADTSRPAVPAIPNWPVTPLVVTDPLDTMYVYYRDIVTVEFHDSVSGITINDFLRRYQGVVIGGSSYRATRYDIQIPDPGPTFGALDSILSMIEGEPGVTFVLRIPLRAHLIPRGVYPDDGLYSRKSDWRGAAPTIGTSARQLIRLPLAWGCESGQGLSATTRPHWGVLDYTFDQGHPDFDQARVTTFPPPAGSVLQTNSYLSQFAQIRAHGTGITGIVAAVGDNQQGVAGMEWGAQVTLYPYGQGTSTYNAPYRRFEDALLHASGAAVRIFTTSVTFARSANNQQTLANLKRELASYLADQRNLFVYAIGETGLQASASQIADPTLLPQHDRARVSDLDEAIAELLPTLGAQILVVAGSAGDSLWAGTGAGTGSDVWTGGTDVAAPADSVLSLGLPAETEPGFETGTRLFTGTSYAAPFVAGLAAQLMAFDQSLTGAEVRDYIVRGAGVALRNSQAPVRRIDAYGSLSLLARERSGLPLCGNRVWYDGIQVHIDRLGTPEGLAPLVALTSSERVAVEHGGRILSRCNAIWQTCTELFTYTAGQGWAASTNSTSYPSNSAAFRSEFGRSHDGDSAAVIYPGPTSASFEIHLETPPGAGPGQTLATVTPATPDFGAVVAWHPGRDSLLVGVSTFDPSGNVLATTLSKMSRATGGMSPSFLTLPSRELYTAAVSDDGTQFLVQTRTEPAGPCTIEYRDWATGNTVLQSVTQPGGVCQNGTKGTFLRAAVRR
ncbi:MAG: S8 family serine peptidase, partial [Gemmatimonadota bacterium]|nr:S8 family serine peptidase [Gemmatimonadota bacterium]